MIRGSDTRTLGQFLQKEFSRVSQSVAQEICEAGKLAASTKLGRMSQDKVERLYSAIGQTKIMAPPTNCLAAIGETALVQGVKQHLVQLHFARIEAKKQKQREHKAEDGADQEAEQKVLQALSTVQEQGPDLEESAKVKTTHAAGGSLLLDILGDSYFVTAYTRPPRVYRGNPFQVEAALAYGGQLGSDELATLHRFANHWYIAKTSRTGPKNRRAPASSSKWKQVTKEERNPLTNTCSKSRSQIPTFVWCLKRQTGPLSCIPASLRSCQPKPRRLSLIRPAWKSGS